jgi:hypothetical protein
VTGDGWSLLGVVVGAGVAILQAQISAFLGRRADRDREHRTALREQLKEQYAAYGAFEEFCSVFPWPRRVKHGGSLEPAGTVSLISEAEAVRMRIAVAFRDFRLADRLFESVIVRVVAREVHRVDGLDMDDHIRLRTAQQVLQNYIEKTERQLGMPERDKKPLADFEEKSEGLVTFIKAQKAAEEAEPKPRLIDEGASTEPAGRPVTPRVEDKS